MANSADSDNTTVEDEKRVTESSSSTQAPDEDLEKGTVRKPDDEHSDIEKADKGHQIDSALEVEHLEREEASFNLHFKLQDRKLIFENY